MKKIIFTLYCVLAISGAKAQPYVGEIRMFGGNYAPNGWAFCDGQELSISENDVLFQIIGTTYGGDGQNTFKLPDFRGRTPIHYGTMPGGSTYVLGQMAGSEAVTLTTQQLPSHNHTLYASTDKTNTNGPSIGAVSLVNADGSVTKSGFTKMVDAVNPATTNLHPSSVEPAGGNQPVSVRSPYVGINYIISLFGVFPSQ